MQATKEAELACWKQYFNQVLYRAPAEGDVEEHLDEPSTQLKLNAELINKTQVVVAIKCCTRGKHRS